MASQRPSKTSSARSVASAHPPSTAAKHSGFFGALCLPTRTSRSVPPTPKTQPSTPNPEKQKPTRRNSHRNSFVGARAEKSPSCAHVVEEVSTQPKIRQRNDSVWLATDFLWPSGSSIPRPYMGLAKEDDLWLPTGDCLVYFEDSLRKSPPTPSLRVESRTIAGAGIPFLNELLAAGKRSRRSSQVSNPKSPTAYVSPNYPNSHRLSPPKRQLRRSSVGYLPLPKMVSPLKFPQFDVLADAASQTKKLTQSSLNRRYSTHSDNKFEDIHSSYEIWFAVPEHLSDHEKHKHKLTIRNLLAMLHNRPIVGPEMIQAICEVQELLDAFSVQNIESSPNHTRSNRPSNETMSIPKKNIVTTYMTSMRLDDVRHNLRQALILLRWTESHSTRWDAGYSETFTHIVGMLIPRTIQTPEFKRLSTATRHNLLESYNALQMVTVEAEDKLKSFDLSQMWNLQKHEFCGAQQSYDAFRNLLVSFYRNKYGMWPPAVSGSNGTWLDRDIVSQLQTDFGALYEYLVDRNVQWDNMKACYRRQWEMGRRGSEVFKADAYIPITDMIVEFDDFHGLLHIPYPYPLLPLGHVGNTSRRGSYHSMSTVMNAAAFNQTESLKTSMAYSAATNVNRLSHVTQGNELLEAFRYHEKSTILDGISLQEARLGRWILLYGVLQVLSVLSVDAPGLRYKADVNYFLCASLNKPPWVSDETSKFRSEPAQTKSYCWTASDRWAVEKPIYRASMGVTQLDDDRATPRGYGHLLRVDSPLTDISSRLTGTDWGDTDLGYSPVSEGAAQLLPLQYGYKGRLLEVEKGGRVIHSLA